MRADRLELLASRDWREVRATVEELGELLARQPLADKRRTEIEARLVALTNHEHWEVRVALARALQHLRIESIHVALSRLLDDDNPHVRRAAAQSESRRFEVTQSGFLREKDEVLWQRVLGKLMAHHGNTAREAVTHAAERYTEYIVRATNHEVRKAVTPLADALSSLRTSLESPRLDRERCSRKARRAWDRLELVIEILDSLEKFVTEVTPAFRLEKVHDLVAEAVALIRERGPEGKKLHARLVIPKGLEIDVHRVRLVLAFSNLIQNSVEAYAKGERPTVRVETAEDHAQGTVALRFSDHGCGIAEAGVKDAFRLFATTKARGGGFGLPFAKRIVEFEHRGSIKLESREGEGTTVTVVLPVEHKERT